MNSVIPAYNYSQNFQEFLMGQASKGFYKYSTSGRLGCRSEGLYKEIATIKNGACNWRRNKKRRTHCI